MPNASPPLPKLPAAHAKRLAWALDAYGHLLAAAVKKDTSAEAREVEKLPDGQVPEHVARLIQKRADPTVAKTMTGWLVRQYAERALRLEDLGTAYETLDMFHRYAQRLPKGAQDLGQYRSLAKVWEVVSPLAEAEQDKLSGKAQKAMDRDKAYAQSRILRQDEDGFTIAVPLTEFAAKWWGRGTRWCTAAEKDNRFWQYHQEAPLIVVTMPELKEKGKFQLWVTKRSVQFMDASDQRPPKDSVAEYWPQFERLMLHAVAQNGEALEYVPESLRTEEMCNMALAQNGLSLKYVPEAFRTDEMCRIAAAQNGRALKYVPETLRTDEMCRIAVAQNGRALEFVPKMLRTEEMCRIAVAENGWAFEFVPKKLRTQELWSIAVAQEGRTLRYAPEGLRTDEMCRIAVAQHGWALRYVPEEFRTDAMYRIAVAKDGTALGHVPEKFRTDEMCRIAVAQNGAALKYVPETLRTDEMCRIAVAQNGRALQYVPQKLCTDEMYSIAVAQDGEALGFVPLERRTDELCRIAVAQYGVALMCVPDGLRTDELCCIAVAQNWRALTYAPEALLDCIKAFIPPPVPEWDISLLEGLVSLLDTAPPSARSGPPHA